MALVNDYIATSNNSINENKFNAAKLSSSATKTTKMHKVKQMLKPVLAILKKKSSKKSCTYIKSVEDDPMQDCCLHCTYYTHNNISNSKLEEEWNVPAEYDSAYESDQNDANELLEQRIFDEIDNIGENMGVPVYYNQHTMQIIPINRGQHYIPVHFAKTEHGTFFWTTMSSAATTATTNTNTSTPAPDTDLCCHNSMSEGQTAEEQVDNSEKLQDRWAQA